MLIFNDITCLNENFYPKNNIITSYELGTYHIADLDFDCIHWLTQPNEIFVLPEFNFPTEFNACPDASLQERVKYLYANTCHKRVRVPKGIWFKASSHRFRLQFPPFLTVDQTLLSQQSRICTALCLCYLACPILFNLVSFPWTWSTASHLNRCVNISRCSHILYFDCNDHLFSWIYYMMTSFCLLD